MNLFLVFIRKRMGCVVFVDVCYRLKVEKFKLASVDFVLMSN